ncbi:MAG: Rnase Y domain-containing protein, partial [Acidobacteriota bacterium]
MNLVEMLSILAAFALGAAAHLAYRHLVAARRIGEAEEAARRLREDAERDAAARLKEVEIEAREQAAATERRAQEEHKQRRREL